MSRFNPNSAMAQYTANGRYNAVSGIATQSIGRARGSSQFAMGSQIRAIGDAQQGSLAPLFGIIVTNASASAVSNLDIFGASKNLYKPTIGGVTADFNSAGALVSGGVTIQTLYSSSITYLEFLSSTMNQVFNVGSIHMSVTSGNTNQSYQTFLTTQKAQDGSLNTKPNTPLLDPATQQAGVSQSYVEFAINGLASMSWSSFFAATTLQISFFPSTTINPSNALVGQSVQKGWNAAL